MLRNNRGFSLIELMVVVAIIAILSTIAIPSYQTFQAKARQKEGMALLGAYYTAAHAVRAEIGGFPGNFVLTGFSPTGMLGYRVLAAQNGMSVPAFMGFVTDAACITTENAVACDCAGMCASFKQWQENAIGVVGTNLGPFAPTMAAMVAAQTFSISTAGVIDTRATQHDEWTVNQVKTFTQVSDGTK